MKIDPCLGIAVEYDPKLRVISESRGIWRWQKIVVGPSLFSFPPREQVAILYHEVGHCKMRHVEKRLLAMWRIVFPSRLAAYCKEQEFAADRFAALMGYGQDLARAFMRAGSSSAGPFHPTSQERIQRLQGY